MFLFCVCMLQRRPTTTTSSASTRTTRRATASRRCWPATGTSCRTSGYPVVIHPSQTLKNFLNCSTNLRIETDCNSIDHRGRADVVRADCRGRRGHRGQDRRAVPCPRHRRRRPGTCLNRICKNHCNDILILMFSNPAPYYQNHHSHCRSLGALIQVMVI